MKPRPETSPASSPQAPPRAAPIIRRRIPLFHPVPVAPRSDGWTVQRQGDFIGHLAETRSVLTACRRVGMGRESAYRLRRRPGAAGFAAAWDAALGQPHCGFRQDSAKSTQLSPMVRWELGLVKVVMRRGRFVRSIRKDDEKALMQAYAQALRAAPGRRVVR